MPRWLRDLRVIFAALLILSWGAGATLYYFLNHSKKESISKLDTKITSLNTRLQQVGPMSTVYKVNTDVTTGEQITSSQLQPVSIPASQASHYVQNEKQVIGQYYKENTSSGTPLLKDNVDKVQIANSTRLYDVVLNQIPVGLQVGDYIDIRISMPLGEDYIGLSHERVYAINDSVVKIGVDEQDILNYDSMLIDTLIFPGSELYATQYVEGVDQKPATVDYPMSKDILSVAERDPNLLSALKSSMINKRNSLVKGLNAADPSTKNSQVINQEISQGRAKYQAQFNAAVRQYELAQQQQKQHQQEVAQSNKLQQQAVAAQKAQQAAQKSKNNRSNSTNSTNSTSGN